MAIVKTYHHTGCTIHIDDSEYAGVPEEEIKRRIETTRRVAWGIIHDAVKREQEAKNTEKSG